MDALPFSYSELLAELDKEEASLAAEPELQPEKSSEEIEVTAITTEQKAAATLVALKHAYDSECILAREKLSAQRSQIAQRARRLKSRIRKHARRIADFEARKVLSEKLLAAEIHYNQIVGEAAEDCLAAVTRVASLVLRRELAVENSTLRTVIERELQTLQFQRIKAVKVPKGAVASCKHLAILVEVDENLHDDEAAIVTAAGEIQISLSKDLERIIKELHSLLLQEREQSGGGNLYER